MEMKRTIALVLLLVALAATAAQARDLPATMSSEGPLPVAEPDKPPGAPATPTPPPTRSLLRIAEMTLTTQPNGSVTVPAKFQGQSGQMMVDTGAVISAISDTLAIRLRLPGRQIRGGQFELMGGVRMSTIAQLSRFALGDMPGDDIVLLVAPYSTLDNDTAGILGADIMAHYDVELDFAGAKFKLFDPDHCPGQVVYWTHEPYAAVPFKLDNGNHMRIELMLDGKEILAAVDTGAERSTMTMDDFESLFGYRAKSDPNMKLVEHASINGTESTAIYRYPFQTLTFEGIQVQHPNIDIVDGDRFDPGAPKLVLGVETLRQLHMYIAYHEGKLYLTAAEAR